MEKIFKKITYYIGKDSGSDKYTLNIPAISSKGYFEVVESHSKTGKKGLIVAEERAKELIFNYINSKVS